MGRVMDVEEQTLERRFNEIVEPLNYVKTTLGVLFLWSPYSTEPHISLAVNRNAALIL
jgi:hypothetical protein